jgi:hypothetical protein
MQAIILPSAACCCDAICSSLVPLLLLQGASDELMRKAIVNSRSEEYTAFGAAALLLNLIPVGDCTAICPALLGGCPCTLPFQCHKFVKDVCSALPGLELLPELRQCGRRSTVGRRHGGACSPMVLSHTIAGGKLRTGCADLRFNASRSGRLASEVSVTSADARRALAAEAGCKAGLEVVGFSCRQDGAGICSSFMFQIIKGTAPT